jgi:(2R)-3-sulfolactate dehydrogenase (NADP+)
MPKVNLSKIQEYTHQALVNYGAKDWIAQSVSRAVRRSEETGNVICGLYYLESYCMQLKSGRVDGQVDPIITKPKRGAVKSDALFGFAQSAFDKGYVSAIESAKENGISSFAVANAHTCTSLGYFTELIASKGMIGLGFTNASPVVAPPGGQTAVIGTNPIAMTVPGNDRPLMHFDFSTSAVALGKITMAKASGIEIPLGWALDSNGQPTTDPEEALGGTLVSTGGYKGWGFGLMSEIFAAGVTGSVNSLDIKGLKSPEGRPHGIGQFYIIIDATTYSDKFEQRFERISDAVKDQDGARIPGASRIKLDPIDIPNDLWKTVLKLAKN